MLGFSFLVLFLLHWEYLFFLNSWFMNPSDQVMGYECLKLGLDCSLFSHMLSVFAHASMCACCCMHRTDLHICYHCWSMPVCACCCMHWTDQHSDFWSYVHFHDGVQHAGWISIEWSNKSCFHVSFPTIVTWLALFFIQ